ncbi:MAG TPA: hypothetical protein VH309_09840 [Elusimicrobiota bacterium]|jgi:hypothetical protein|nr:hypothetical protein [Elusimicrobiota bacterium]
MNALPFLALVLAASASPARAQAGPAARIGALFEGAPSLGGAAIPPLASVPAPAAVPTAAPNPPQPAPADSVVPPGLWATLAAPDAATLSFLSARIPGLDAAEVRVLPLDAADAMFAAAAARGESPLDLFTDPGFRGAAVFFIAQADIRTLFARYEIRVLTAPSGVAKDGKPFAMQALLLGGGSVDALYDRDRFDFDNPLFPGHSYKAAALVTQRILAPGDVAVEGVWVHAGIVTPRITRVVKLSATEGRVETNRGSRNRPVTPIRRR